MPEEVLLLRRILPDEELHRLSGAHELHGKQSLGEAEVFRLDRLCRRRRGYSVMRMSRDVGRTMNVAVVDVGLRQVQVAEIDLVAELNDVGVAIFQLQGEGSSRSSGKSRNVV